MVVFVADISNWQGALDAGRVVREGYAAVVAKATEGTDFRDARFGTYIAQTVAAGGIPGAYHFLRAGDGAAQARSFHTRIVEFGGPDGWLVQLDCEADASYATAKAFAVEWARLTGGHPLLLYTGTWWWGAAARAGWDGPAVTPLLWHSHYVTGSDAGSVLYGQVGDSWWTPGYGGWAHAALLQFSSTALVAGQKIDVSAFRGSLDDLRALTTSKGDDMTPDQARQLADVHFALTEHLFDDGHGGVDDIGADHITRLALWRGVRDIRAALAKPATVVLSDADRSAIAKLVTAEVRSEFAALRQVLAAAERAEADKLAGP